MAKLKCVKHNRRVQVSEYDTFPYVRTLHRSDNSRCQNGFGDVFINGHTIFPELFSFKRSKAMESIRQTIQNAAEFFKAEGSLNDDE